MEERLIFKQLKKQKYSKWLRFLIQMCWEFLKIKNLCIFSQFQSVLGVLLELPKVSTQLGQNQFEEKREKRKEKSLYECEGEWYENETN